MIIFVGRWCLVFRVPGISWEINGVVRGFRLFVVARSLIRAVKFACRHCPLGKILAWAILIRGGLLSIYRHAVVVLLDPVSRFILLDERVNTYFVPESGLWIGMGVDLCFPERGCFGDIFGRIVRPDYMTWGI